MWNLKKRRKSERKENANKIKYKCKMKLKKKSEREENANKIK